MLSFEALRQRKIFQWALAYLAGAWVLMQLASWLADVYGWPNIVLRALPIVLVVGLVITLVVAWFHGERGHQRVTAAEIAVLAATIVLAGISLGWVVRSQPVSSEKTVASAPAEASVAVLPFVDMSAQKDQEYFGDGITEEILNGLAQIQGLRVPGRTSSFSFKGKDLPIRDIAQQLGVTNILEGSVRKAGNRVRITAQLIDARTDQHVWSEQYDRDLDDIFAVQGEIASAIVAALKLRMQPKATEIVARETGSGIAHELYLKGLYYWNRRHADELPLSIEYFKQAIREDSMYASAWAGLALAYAVVPQFVPMNNQETVPLGKAAANHALRLDPKSSDAHAALGQIATEFEWNWNAAQQHLDAALALDPKSATAHQWRAELDLVRGDTDKGLAEIDRALAIDPLSSVMMNIRGTALRRAGRLDEAIAQFHTIKKHDPGFQPLFVNANLMLTLFMAKRYDDLMKLFAGDKGTQMFIEAVRDPGKRPMGLQMLSDPTARQNMGPLELSMSYTLLEQYDSAAAVLDRAATNTWQAQLAFAVHDPISKPIMKYPAFQSFRRKVHL